MSEFLFFIFSNRSSLKFISKKQNKNKLCITDMSENKTNNLNNTCARYEFISFENTQRITDPSEASNNFFFFVERPRILMAVAT